MKTWIFGYIVIIIVAYLSVSDNPIFETQRQKEEKLRLAGYKECIKAAVFGDIFVDEKIVKRDIEQHEAYTRELEEYFDRLEKLEISDADFISAWHVENPFPLPTIEIDDDLPEEEWTEFLEALKKDDEIIQECKQEYQ